MVAKASLTSFEVAYRIPERRNRGFPTASSLQPADVPGVAPGGLQSEVAHFQWLHVTGGHSQMLLR